MPESAKEHLKRFRRCRVHKRGIVFVLYMHLFLPVFTGEGRSTLRMLRVLEVAPQYLR